jgi:predicted SprT family Zn-dependent metalloprotease
MIVFVQRVDNKTPLKEKGNDMELSLLRGIASQKLYQHKLIGWSFGIGDFGRRAGVCKHSVQRIEIQEYYALHNPQEEVMDTLMHEIAHALTPGHKHDAFWKAVAIQLGATPVSCNKKNVAVKPGDWKATCDECGKVYYKYKASAGLESRRFGCVVCKNIIMFEWVGDPADKPKPIPMYQASCACGNTFKRPNLPRRRKYHCRKCKTSLVWIR